MKFVVQDTKRPGAPTILLDGKPLHSTYDPIKEAERVAAMVPEGTRLACVLGPGLGYLVEAAALRAGEVLTVCADAELLAFVENRRAAENRPLPGRAIPAEASIDQWEEILARVPNLATGRAVLLEGAYEPGREEAYARAQENFTKALDRIVERTLTLTAFGPIYLENFLKNIRAGAGRFMDPAPINDLLGGKSVILAAPGPTLETAISDLAQSRRAAADRRVPLLAVDSAAVKLARNGIRPDFIFTLDPQRHVGRMLDPESMAGKVPVVGLPTACPEALAAGSETLLFGQGYPLEAAMPNPLFIPGDGDFGGSVSTFAASVAEWAGAAEVILVGQDFGYPFGKEYAAGGVMEDFSLERVNRFAGLETIRKRAPEGVTVETIGGSRVPTRQDRVVERRDPGSRDADQDPVLLRLRRGQFGLP